MRIRNRSGALFTSTSCIDINTSHGNGEEEFLLPLVAAVMDVQRSEKEEPEVKGEGDHGTRMSTTAFGIHTRPANNWRNALQLQRTCEGNTESQALEDGGEGKKADCRWKGSMRNQLDSIDMGIFTKKGTEEPLLEQNTSSTAEKDIKGGHDEEWKLPKSGGVEMRTLWRQQKNFSLHGIKRKRSKNVIVHIKEWKHETNTTKRNRQETVIGRKVDEKALPNERYNNNNEAEGSQCRRRNGRGWRCSQRTLVGYSLCEYHLGKGRLRNNNKKSSRVIVNNKVGTCKFKELRLIDAS